MPMPSNEVRRNLLPNEPIESFWDAMWLGIQPFLCFTVESRRIACRCLQTKRVTICCRMNRSRASGTPCGSVFGHFCVLPVRPVPSRPIPPSPVQSRYNVGHLSPMTSRGIGRRGRQSQIECTTPKSQFGPRCSGDRDIAKKPKAKANSRSRSSGNKSGGWGQHTRAEGTRSRSQF